MKILIFLWLYLFFNSSTEAQKKFNSLEYARMSGAGPFPRYITIKGLRYSQNPYNTFLGGYANDLGVDPKCSLYGFDINIGSINMLGNKRGFFGNAFGVEAGLKFVNSRGTQSGDSTLYINSKAVNLLLKYRVNILYPLTVQFTGGPILFNRFRYINLSDTRGSRSSIRGGKFLSGYQVSSRLVLFDPVGTNGGLGVYFEMCILNYFKDEAFERVLSRRYPNAEIDKSRLSCGIGIGVLAPLALLRR